jgi:hypothetical protein
VAATEVHSESRIALSEFGSESLENKEPQGTLLNKATIGKTIRRLAMVAIERLSQSIRFIA